MPRSNLDQALVTGLTLTANHAIASLVQDSIAAGALALVAGVDADHDRRWGQATLGLDVAVTVGEPRGSSELLRQRPREPMAVSAARTGAWFVGVSAGAASAASAATRRRRAAAGSAPAVPGRDPDHRHRDRRPPRSAGAGSHD